MVIIPRRPDRTNSSGSSSVQAAIFALQIFCLRFFFSVRWPIDHRTQYCYFFDGFVHKIFYVFFYRKYSVGKPQFEILISAKKQSRRKCLLEKPNKAYHRFFYTKFSVERNQNSKIEFGKNNRPIDITVKTKHWNGHLALLHAKISGLQWVPGSCSPEAIQPAGFA